MNNYSEYNSEDHMSDGPRGPTFRQQAAIDRIKMGSTDAEDIRMADSVRDNDL